jgi:hypothetical protein
MTQTGTRIVRCAVPGCASGQPAAGRARVCTPCVRALDRKLAGLPALYAQCETRLAGGAPRQLGEVRGRAATPGLPFNGAVADVRAAIVTTLARWSATVATGRDVPAPQREVAAMVTFLRRHAGWVANQPHGADLAVAAAALVRQARAEVSGGAAAPRRVQAGSCVEPDCPGELIALLDSGERPLPGQVECSADPAHVWPAHTWAALGRRMSAGPCWLSVSDIALLAGAAPGSVYRLASTHGWRRRSRAGRTLYHGDDVQQTLDRA